jgi:hypothetical protein
VLSTFGLIAPSKGIELAIEALTKIVPRHPDVLYLIAGRTHPEVAKEDGEQYRLSLARLVRDRGLEDHVRFLDRFLSTVELSELLGATDIYLTPYRSRDQIVSGALTFAVVAGCPVVSTPYLYAEDLLSTGAGILVPFDDPAAFGEAVLSFLDDPDRRAAAAAEARRIGSTLTWPAVGNTTLQVLRDTVRHAQKATARRRAAPVPAPAVRTGHLLTLTDDVGIVQHADGVVPLRSTGYCVDDAARLVIVALGLDRDRSDPHITRLVTLGLSLLRHAWDGPDAGMHNLMSFQRQWIDTPSIGDHVGRTIWALGEVIAAHPPRAVAVPSLRQLEAMLPTMQAHPLSPRCTAFTVLGLTRLTPRTMTPAAQQVLETLAAQLFNAHLGTASPEWCWFEDQLTYDNARLSQALIAAGHRLDNPAWLSTGLASLDWYGTQCGIDTPVIQLVGNRWRHRRNPDPKQEGDEQPLDAAALVEAYIEARKATGDPAYGVSAVHAFEWFLGRNRLGTPIYDFATGGCHDGLGRTGINGNEGAESTLAYYQALTAVESADLQTTRPTP